ncbi:YmfQ family protein [Paenibacillus pasadenensis]|uniref:putative phage tail protein n=1 Tax=Paenibacillus pasadenensis TaxID=217090 RepID=UPI00203EEFF3|nr:putative phage tail protein [Paenibacillus pasadenensis]MCM3747466.1 YmfQ family protein [Paenibacillus pasadenensis]
MSDRLIGYLPDLYDEVIEMYELLQSEGEELDLLFAGAESLLDQSYPESATWGLDRYERDLNLVIELGKPVDQRRSVIISKMRGYGKASGSLLKNVAQAYSGGTISVTVFPSERRILITFVDTLGLPPNLDDLKAAIEEIKPAHLILDYKFRYLLVQEVQGMTINQLQQRKLTDFAPFLEEG